MKYSDLFPGLYPDHLVMSRDLAEFVSELTEILMHSISLWE